MIPDPAMALPTLWICGPPGVGKSTVAWEIFRGLRPPCAFVDIDQLGMCYPEPPDDPGRERLKAANLAAVARGYQAIGAQCLVVSGVVDSERGVGDVPGLALTWCRLRADREDLGRRLASRDDQPPNLDAVWHDAERLDAGIIDGPVIETTGLGPSEVVRHVRDVIGDWPGPGRGSPAAGGGEAGAAGGSVLWLCGATGVGKSAVGFAAFLRQISGGAAFVDLDQIAFCRPDGGHRLRAANLAAIWTNFRAAGARRLVIVGPASSAADIELYRAALPRAKFTVIRLHASPEELTRRIALRGAGHGWAQPGDPLRDQPADRLAAATRAAIAAAAALEEAGIGARIDTTDMSVAKVAAAVLARGEWSAEGDRQ